MTNNKLPKFKNIKEEAKFWDTHSFSDFTSESKPVNIKLNLSEPKDEILTLRLQPQLKAKLNLLATDMGVQTSTLARMWLIEKLKTIPSCP